MATILNTGQVFENATATAPIQTAEVNFETFNVDDLVMTKTEKKAMKNRNRQRAIEASKVFIPGRP